MKPTMHSVLASIRGSFGAEGFTVPSREGRVTGEAKR